MNKFIRSCNIYIPAGPPAAGWYAVSAWRYLCVRHTLGTWMLQLCYDRYKRYNPNSFLPEPSPDVYRFRNGSLFIGISLVTTFFLLKWESTSPCCIASTAWTVLFCFLGSVNIIIENWRDYPPIKNNEPITMAKQLIANG